MLNKSISNFGFIIKSKICDFLNSDYIQIKAKLDQESIILKARLLVHFTKRDLPLLFPVHSFFIWRNRILEKRKLLWLFKISIIIYLYFFFVLQLPFKNYQYHVFRVFINLSVLLGDLPTVNVDWFFFYFFMNCS